jgi:hypothetical protein
MKTATARFASPFIRSFLLVLALLVLPAASSAAVYVSVDIAPPPIPLYEQPLVPGPGYIWVPGYWAYGPDGYYWVPGTWVLAPYVGALWTPGYWGWNGIAFIWNAGYWGPHIGFYGGINYGCGYFGHGYDGGYWNHGVFSYNTAVTNVNTTYIHNTYNRTVVGNTSNLSRVSFHGGNGGTTVQPTALERTAASDRHTPATSTQVRHERLAATDRAQLASVNHGTPALAVTPRAAAFSSQNAGPGNIAGRSQNTGPARGNVAGSAMPGATPQEQKAARIDSSHTRSEARVERGNLNPSGGGSPQNTGHPQTMGRVQSTPHPQAHVQNGPQPMQARIQNGPPQTHVQNGPPQMQARIQNAPPMQARVQAAPHPQGQPQPHPQGQPEPHPQGQPHEGQHGEEGRNR